MLIQPNIWAVIDINAPAIAPPLSSIVVRVPPFRRLVSQPPIDGYPLT
jgi:hypothetical protein